MPPLQKRVIDVPLAKGPNDKINPHLRDVSIPDLMENCYQSKTGKVRMRSGSTLITNNKIGGGSISSVGGLYGQDGELLLQDADGLYSYSALSSGWAYKGHCPPVDVSAKAIAPGPLACDPLDMASIGNWTCYLHNLTTETDSGIGNACFTLIDESTGTEVISSQDLDSASSPLVRIAAICALQDSEKFVIVYTTNPSAANLYCKIISGMGTTTVTVSSAVLLVNDAANNLGNVSRVEVIEVGGTEFCLAYEDTAGDLSLNVFDEDGVSQHSVTETPAGTLYNFSILYDGPNDILYAYFWDSTSIKCRGYNDSLAAQWATATIDTLSAGENQGNFGIGAVVNPSITTRTEVYWTVGDTELSEARIDRNRTDTAGLVGGTTTLARSCILVSKPFVVDGAIHFFADRREPVGDSAENLTGAGSVFLMRTVSTVGRMVARVLVAQHPGASTAPGFNNQPWANNLSVRNVKVSGLKVTAPFLRADASSLVTRASDVTYYKTSVMAIEFDLTEQSMPSIIVNDVTLLAGPGLYVYDGDAVYVAGLEFQHPAFRTAQGAAAGAILADGDYGVCILYRWVDGRGNEYWSPPQYHEQTIAAGAGAASIDAFVTGPPLEEWGVYNGLTDKADASSKVQLAFCRTTVGPGSIYYIERMEPNDESLIGLGTFRWGLSATPGADADIAKNANLYTTGGVLSYVLPPTPHHIASDGDTAALIPGDKRDTVWVSTPIVSGEGVRFTDDLVYDIPAGGDAEAVAFMDGRLIVFKGRQIRYMLGEPPNALGQFGYSGSELITEDVGCVNWRSVVRVPQGLLFQSHKGFYLLGRDLNVSYVGAPVESYNDEDVLSVVVLRDDNQVRVCMSGGDVIVWDYYHNNWPKFTGLSAVASALWSGDWTVSKSDATIGGEGSSALRDYGSTDITAKYRTGWLRLSAINGYQRVRRLVLLGHSDVSSIIENDVTVKTYVDYDSLTAKETLLSAGAISVAANSPFISRVTLGSQKMSALMVEMSWLVARDGPLSMSAISFECAAKKGAPRLSAANTR